MTEETPRTADEEIEKEREEVTKWHTATSSQEYDETVMRDANDIVDKFVAAQQNPETLKELVAGMDRDYDRLNFARGVVYAMTRVLGWKARAQAGIDEMMENDAAERQPETEDTDAAFVWADR